MNTNDQKNHLFVIVICNVWCFDFIALAFALSVLFWFVSTSRVVHLSRVMISVYVSWYCLLQVDSSQCFSTSLRYSFSSMSLRSGLQLYGLYVSTYHLCYARQVGLRGSAAVMFKLWSSACVRKSPCGYACWVYCFGDLVLLWLFEFLGGKMWLWMCL